MDLCKCGRCGQQKDIPTEQYIVLDNKRSDLCIDCYSVLRRFLYVGGTFRLKSKDMDDRAGPIRLAQEKNGNDVYLTKEGYSWLRKWFNVSNRGLEDIMGETQ